MRVDISYILSFPADKRRDVTASLGELCVNTPGGGFDPSLISESCSVMLLLAEEELAEPAKRDLPRRADGRAPVGHVQLWITTAGDRVTLELWPTTSSVGRACLGSASLRRSLVALLRQHDGSKLQLDRSDGSIVTLYER